MIRRLLVATFVALFLLPAAAHASVTRAIQAVTFAEEAYWSPQYLNAQVGDTVEWRLTEPGNPNASKHDVWLIKPGESGNGTQLGSSQTNGGIARTVVSQPGVYTYYDTVHGGLNPGGMHGTINVTTTDPGPPVDPGYPWMIPGSEYPGDAWQNPTQAPTVFEEGDTTPPTITLVSAKPKDQAVVLTVYTSEPGQLTATVTHKKKKQVVVDSTKSYDSVLGTNAIKVKLPATPGDYLINVVAADESELESDTLVVSVVVSGKTPKAVAAAYRRR